MAARAIVAAGALLLGATVARGDDGVPAQAELAPARPRWAVGVEAGWNGLGGIGPLVTWSPGEALAVEGAAGYSRNGPKAGLRVRGNAPLLGLTAGAGLVVAAGHAEHLTPEPKAFPPIIDFGPCVGEPPGCPDARDVRVGPTLSLQLTAGFQVRGVRGGGLLVLGGWSQRLAGGHARWSAPPNAEQLRYVRQTTGSGPVVALALRFGL
jgi:hypothetical protein